MHVCVHVCVHKYHLNHRASHLSGISPVCALILLSLYSHDWLFHNVKGRRIYKAFLLYECMCVYISKIYTELRICMAFPQYLLSFSPDFLSTIQSWGGGRKILEFPKMGGAKKFRFDQLFLMFLKHNFSCFWIFWAILVFV